jgi:hypothetical protein
LGSDHFRQKLLNLWPIFNKFIKNAESDRMKIRGLIIYSILPLAVLSLYFLIWWTDQIKYISIEKAVGQLLLGGFIYIIVIVLLFLFLFAFFKDKIVPILLISLFVFLNTLLTLSLGNSKLPLLTTIYDYSEAVTLILLLFLAIGYFVFAVRFLLKIKGNGLLLLSLLSGGLIFTYDFIYFGLLLADPSFGKGIFTTLGLGLFLLFSLIIIISLPNSDYVEWKKDHKQLFLRSILIPWCLILFLAFINFIVTPVSDKSQERKSKITSFKMFKYDIKQKDGL